MKSSHGPLEQRYRALLEALRAEPKRDVIVMPHLRIDGDALASALAAMALLKELGKRPRLYLAETLPPYLAAFAAACLPAADYGVYGTASCPELPEDPLLFLVDCHAPDRLGARSELWQGDGHAFIVDHHPGVREMSVREIIEPSRASAAELMAELLFCLAHERGKTFAELYGPALATGVLLGIYTDTGGLRFGALTPELYRLVADLVAAGADVKMIYGEVFNSKSLPAQRLAGYALSHFEVLAEGRLAFLAVPYAIRSAYGASGADFEGLVNQLLATEGALFAILLREFEDQSWQVSFRAMWPHDISALAARYGGGGHRQASGLTLSLEAQQECFGPEDPLAALRREAIDYCREEAESRETS